MAKKVGELIRELQADNWYIARQGATGHRKFRHPTKPGTLVVSGKLSSDMKPGTYNSILKQAGLK